MTEENSWGKTALGRRMKVKGEATSFRIWQVANSLGWDCTISECAKIAEIPYSTAHSAVSRKGWTKRFNEEAVMEAKLNGITKQIYKRQRNANSDLVDVCDLMARNTL